MVDFLAAALIGLFAGYLSGRFGVGGAIITTPAIRLLLEKPELIAVGTPLPVIIPTAVAGAIAYARRGLVDVRTGVLAGAFGAVFSVAGALVTPLTGGRLVLLVTAALICWIAVDMMLRTLRPPRSEPPPPRSGRPTVPRAGALGAVTGLCSGFLGLGGGFVVVPALVRYFGFDIKRAIGTSLLVVSVLAVPGSVTHYLLGNVDVSLALALVLGVVPGALIGARATARASERAVRVAFAATLLIAGAVLAASELGVGR